jgi:hypothetical protein
MDLTNSAGAQQQGDQARDRNSTESFDLTAKEAKKERAQNHLPETDPID